ncbi:MAG: hypothetical protein ABI419_12450, partial [Ginsengibacter sp.]
RNDHYNGINYAFLLNLRASQSSDTAEAIADFIQARRVRKEVLSICDTWLKNNPEPTGPDATQKIVEDYWKGRYWVEATAGEAYVGLENDEKASETLNEVYSKVSEKWMQETTETQVEKLKKLLSDSPLQFIKEKKDQFL